MDGGGKKKACTKQAPHLRVLGVARRLDGGIVARVEVVLDLDNDATRNVTEDVIVWPVRAARRGLPRRPTGQGLGVILLVDHDDLLLLLLARLLGCLLGCTAAVQPDRGAHRRHTTGNTSNHLSCWYLVATKAATTVGVCLDVSGVTIRTVIEPQRRSEVWALIVDRRHAIQRTKSLAPTHYTNRNV